MSSMAPNRVWLLVTLLWAPLPAAAEDAPSAATEDAAAFTASMERSVSNLSSSDFESRRAATKELREAGAAALPFLEAGAADAQAERSIACFNLIRGLVGSEDETIRTQAIQAVRRLAESENAGVAGRADSILSAAESSGESVAIAMLEAAGCRVHRSPTGEISFVSGIRSDHELSLLTSLSSGRITMLSMAGDGITDDGVKHLANVAAIRSLSILRSSMTDAGLNSLGALRNVDSLNLGPGNYTRDGLRELGRSSHFRSLTMHDVSPESLPVLRELPQLRSLSFDNVHFSEAEIGMLNDLDGVKLSVSLFDAVDEHLKLAGQLKNLSGLSVFSREGVTAEGIANLSGLPLEQLTINSPQLTDDALQYLGKIESLTSLFLTGGQMTDSGLQRLYSLKNLRSLAISRQNITDEALQRLQEALPNLRSIHDIGGPLAVVRAPGAVRRPAVRPAIRVPHLDEALKLLNEEEGKALSQLTRPDGRGLRPVNIIVDEDAGLVNVFFHRRLNADDAPLLRKISKLGTLFFSLSRDPVTDEDLELLRGADMHGVIIRKAPVTDAGFAVLTTCPNLQTLSLTETRITDAGLAHLREMPQLIRLSLGTGNFTDAGLAHVGHLSQLVSLSLSDCSQLTDEGFRHLSSLVNLESLMLSRFDGLTSQSLIHLTGLGQLKSLRVNGMQLNQANLAHLTSFENLESLSITSSNLTDEGVQYVARLPALKELFISETDITDAGLATLAQISGLTKLNLNDTNVTDAGLRHLAGLKELSTLALSNTSITGAGLVHLKDMTHIQYLSLDHTDVGDKGLKSLTSMHDLKSLNLEGTLITDAGLNELAQHKNLNFLTVGATSITPAGLEQLEQQLPDCRIISRDMSRLREELQQRSEELQRSRPR